jgi:hypothetical protein
MLRYLRPADEVFLDVLHEALDWMIEDLRENVQDPEAYGDLAPRTARILEAPTAVEALEKLRAASEAPELYALNAAHRLLLVEALIRYCDLFNEEPFGGYGSAVYEKYGVRHVDGERLIAAFIGPVEDPPRQGASQVEALVSGKRLRKDALHLQPVSPEGDLPRILPADASPWYRPGTESYPVLTATA